MRPDPVIDRIREARHRISEKCGHDPQKLLEYYTQRQEQSKERFITKADLAPKKKTATS